MQQLPIAVGALQEALWDCEDEAADDACRFLTVLDQAGHDRVKALANLPLVEDPLRLRAANRLSQD